ncbi:MAG: DUF504 domain-containing protein [Candidatus Odinarchaeota archaeon]
MTKKSKLKELISYAKHKDGLVGYKVYYRDFNRVKEADLGEFLQQQEEEGIPLHRIHKLVKESEILFLKHGCCRICARKSSDLNENEMCYECEREGLR